MNKMIITQMLNALITGVNPTSFGLEPIMQFVNG